MSPGSRELAILSDAARMLAEAETLEEVTEIRDKAEAARVFARAAQLGLTLQNRAAELKLRAERKAGDFLAALKLRGGDRKSKGHRVPLKLADLGISLQQSKRWQRLALVTERDFAEFLRVTNASGREVTSAGLHRIARFSAGLNARGDGTAAGSSGGKEPGRGRDTTQNESIAELMNHCRLLVQILRPVSEGGDFQLQVVERRLVGRLLAEMSDLLKQLNKEWPRAASPPVANKKS